MDTDSEIAIAVLLPDLLGTYADTGNATVLLRRLQWRGYAARLLEVRASDAAPTGCDLYLLGGGEDTAQLTATEWLRGRPELVTTLAERAVTLAVCAGLQVLGHAVTDSAGRRHPGVGVLDVATAPGRCRTVGEALAVGHLPGIGMLTGFHNHGGITVLGPDATPLATTVRGPSNHPRTHVEGACTRGDTGPGVVATYLHGPVLARNPALADHLLGRALGAPPPPLDRDLVPDLPALRRRYLGRGYAGRRPLFIGRTRPRT